MAYRFNGSYSDWPKMHGSTGPRGVKRSHKALRRIDAIERNAQTPHERTKQHRVRCSAFGNFNFNPCPLA